MKKFLISILILFSFAFAYTDGYSVFPNLECDNFIADSTIITSQALDYQTLNVQTAVDTSATTDATITPLGAFQRVDTWQDQAISTVNLIATADLAIGTEIMLMTVNSTRDIVLLETGNMALGATSRSLTNNTMALKLMRVEANKWIETGFFSN